MQSSNAEDSSSSGSTETEKNPNNKSDRKKSSLSFVPNTVGFPPSRTSLTYSTGGKLGSVKGQFVKTLHNPFTTKRVSIGSGGTLKGRQTFLNVGRRSSTTIHEGIPMVRRASMQCPQPHLTGSWAPGNHRISSPIIFSPSSAFIEGENHPGGQLMSTSTSTCYSHPKYPCKCNFRNESLEAAISGGMRSSNNSPVSTASTATVTHQQPQLPNPFSQLGFQIVGNRSQNRSHRSSETYSGLPTQFHKSTCETQFPCTVAALTSKKMSETQIHGKSQSYGHGQGQGQGQGQRLSAVNTEDPSADSKTVETNDIYHSDNPTASTSSTTVENPFGGFKPLHSERRHDSCINVPHSTSTSPTKSTTTVPDFNPRPNFEGFVFGNNLRQRVSSTPVPTTTTHDVHHLTDFAKSSPRRSIPSDFCFQSFKYCEGSIRRNSNMNAIGLPQNRKRSLNLVDSSDNFEIGDSYFGLLRRFSDIPTRTGEEEEVNVLQIPCRLYAYENLTSTWMERGCCHLRLNDRGDANNEFRSRIIVRTVGSLQVMLNTNVWADMKFDRASEHSIRFTANDKGIVRLYRITTNAGDADHLFHALKSRVNALEAKQVCSRKNSSSSGAGDAAAVEDAAASSKIARLLSKSQHLVLHAPDNQFNKELIPVTKSETTETVTSDNNMSTPSPPNEETIDDSDFNRQEMKIETDEQIEMHSPLMKKKRLSTISDPED